MVLFHPAVEAWFAEALGAPTPAQRHAWPPIARGESTLVFAPTGSGKTLAAFLACLDRLMFAPVPPRADRCRVLYISPIKALAVDVERNLRAPIAGISRTAAARGDAHTVPRVAIRTGDTPAAERTRFSREPSDILITTPESLFLLLTSRAREVLRAVETVIVDEIHALVPTKRGAHLALSLERLAALTGRPLQRIGLSATERSVDEVSRFLGGAADAGATPPMRGPEGIAAVHDDFVDGAAPAWRPVTVVDERAPKRLALRVEMPGGEGTRAPGGDTPDATAADGGRPGIWAGIHPRLLELVRAHRSTLVFVNSRRLAERLAAALNELAGEPLVRSHHGSMAREQRLEVEEALKGGRVRALVATSSLELGIDMGAVDLVVQIESPPSVASGLQRIGRASHQVDAVSAGVIVPKHRGDLLACAAVTRAMRDGQVEPTRYPRNPLDVLAQQIVAAVAVEPWDAGELFGLVRRAAPFAALSRRAFDNVLDMLSGRYPSDEFADLRPRVTWDRRTDRLMPRESALRIAVTNAGTIPDRGLYGVFLADAAPGAARVGELDEEMVFESREGETFVLGASTWRIDSITHDRVVVSPAPGEPGKMPFWKGDAAGRPRELGAAIGRLARELREMPPAAAVDRLVREHDLDHAAAETLLQYLAEQHAAGGVVPDERTLVIERSRDELGDWRLCLLSPLGGRVLIPWCLAVTARIREVRGLDVQTMWSDDGFVVRVPDAEEPPSVDLLLPDPSEVEALLMRQLGASALFAARFREVAGRALLLPRRRPGGRSPLWHQRKRAADLLAVASRYASFPVLLETYRECLRDVFDLPALVDVLAGVASGSIRTVMADTDRPSPFAASLLFGYVANFIYDGDAPLAERRAQALSVDQAQLRELLGDAELRELIDAAVLEALERQLQALDPSYQARSADGLHDLLLRLGDLSREEIAARSATPAVTAGLDDLLHDRRVLAVTIAGADRCIAVEDAARYRDALRTPVPDELPPTLLEPVPDALAGLVHRYARTHGPFTAAECAERFGVPEDAVQDTLARLASAGRVVEGEFRPGGRGIEWCGADVLRTLRQRSLARLRREIEPVDPPALGRFAAVWQGVARRRRGLDALLDAIEQLQGAPLPASDLESGILPARIEDYDPADLDRLVAAGEVTWAGLEPLGERDGRIGLYLPDQFRLLWPLTASPAPLDEFEQQVVDYLARHGASFFAAMHAGIGAGYPQELVETLWSLVWRGVVTNDAFHALRAYLQPPERRRRRESPAFRTRRIVPPAGEGRWSLLADRLAARPSPTEWATAVARQLLARHGVVTRETMAVEAIPGGYGAVYGVLRAMEDAGRVRRGLFVGGLGAAQFALGPAVDDVRAHRDPPDEPLAIALASTDPANPYGGILPWPPNDGGRPSRSAGTVVILVDGLLAGWLGRRDGQLLAWLPEADPDRRRVAHALARTLARLATGTARDGLLVSTINGAAATTHALAPHLIEAGFTPGALGLARSRKDGRTDEPDAARPASQPR